MCCTSSRSRSRVAARGRFGLPRVGHVLDDADERAGLAEGVQLDGGAAADPAFGAVGTDDPVVPGVGLAGDDRLGERLAHGLALVGMQEAEEDLTADGRVGREPQDAAGFRRPPHAGVGAEADRPCPDAARLERTGQIGMAVPELRAGARHQVGMLPCVRVDVGHDGMGPDSS